MSILAAYMVPHPPLIVPEVGRGDEKAIQNTTNAYHTAAREIGELKPDTIILASPHQTMYADYFHISPGRSAKGDFRQFRAGNVTMDLAYDTEFIDTLCKFAEEKALPAGTLGERERKLDHGTMVPLYFVNQYWQNYKLVRIGLSGLSLARHYELGQCIQKTVETLGCRAVFIASGDLSHKLKEDGPYGYQKEGPEYDARIMDVMGYGAFGELLDFPENFCEKAAECGHRSFTIMAGALDGIDVSPRKLSYEGPFGVGYGICTFTPCGKNPGRNFLAKYEAAQKFRLQKQRAAEDAYVRLARHTIETYIRSGHKPLVNETIPVEMLNSKAGVFVSIKEDGRLRGCIGTIQPVQDCIAKEIIENAVSASTRDPRFSPIEKSELDRLSISVDVLGDTEKISSPDQLDVKRYGVVVTKGHRRGLLLPNLDGVDTIEDQIRIAKQKAGIKDAETVELERFEVVRHF